MLKQKKVLWIKDSFGHKSETFIYEPLRLFKEWQPLLLTREYINKDLFPYEKVKVYNFKDYNNYYWKIKKKIYELDDWTVFIIDQLRKEKARIIHAHFGTNGVYSVGARKIAKKPLVTSFYGFDMSALPRDDYWKNAYQELFDVGDAFCVEGPNMKKDLMLLGCPEEKIHLVRIGIDTTCYPFAQRRFSDKFNILLAGRFVEKKGMEYGILAFAKAAKKYPNITLTIVGDGELKNKLLKLVNNEGISELVKFKGFLNHKHLREEIYNAHLALVPSVTAENGDSEGGAPTVLLEMQASGLPVIASNHADIPFVVNQNRAVKLVEERNIEEIEKSIMEIIDNYDSWAKNAKFGSEVIVQKFSLKNMVIEYERLYNKLC